MRKHPSDRIFSSEKTNSLIGQEYPLKSSALSRRSALHLFAGAVATCSTCISLTQAFASGTESSDHAKAAHWSYEGKEGPAHWDELSPANRVCGLGFEQSPVDLKQPISSNDGKIDVDYKPTGLHVINNGHTIQVNCDPGSSIRLDGHKYDLLQFHFHHPSEHTVNGSAHQMEAHFVHADSQGKLAVLGVFLGAGQENSLLAPIWNEMPLKGGGKSDNNSVKIQPADLLPTDRRFFRYMGSLTTPPCTEIVTWSIYQEPVQASGGQIKKFADLFPMNARPVQSLNRRMLLSF